VAVRGALEVGTTHQGMPGPPGMPWWVVLSSEHPPGAARAHYVPSGPQKISVKFRCIWTPFDIDFLRCKNMQKTATGTWHYVNRLVAKMI